MVTRNPAPNEPLIAWPGWASLRLSLPLAYLFSKIFFSIYGGASLLARLRGAREAFHFDWEMRLPFVPSAAIVYLSVPLLLLLAPFILRTWRTFTPFFFTLTAETLVAGVFFLVIPMAQGYPQRVAYGLGGAIFRLADRLNLEYNEFPSLHVAFAVTAAFVYGRRCGRLGRTLFGLWAVIVAFAALLMHEHHLLDIGAGAALGLAGVATVQRWTSDERVLGAMRVEGLCLRELTHLVRHRPSRLRDVAVLSGASLRRWRETQVRRAAWCLTETARDVLAGARRVESDPGAYVEKIVDELRGEAAFGPSNAEQLAKFLAGEETRREVIEQLATLLAQRSPSVIPVYWRL